VIESTINSAASRTHRKCITVQVIERFSPAIGSRLRKVNGACFVAGTLVSTVKGDVPIEQICEGDLVWSRDVETIDEGWQPVEATFSRSVEELYHLTYAADSGDGQIVFYLAGSAEHPFWVEGKGWVAMSELESGDHLGISFQKEKGVRAAPSGHEVLQVEPQKSGSSGFAVYNFQVANSKIYFMRNSIFSDRLLVHNSNNKHSDH